jgi:hypothetical protein
MAIAAELTSPSGPPSAADWAAVSIAAALETSITAFAAVVSAAVAVTVANDDDHPRNGHDINDCIVAAIKNSILSNSSAQAKFTALVDCDVDWSDCLELMAYILDRYANMRGTYFIRHIKGNVGGNHAMNWAEKQATRSKVATAVYCAKTSSCGIENDDDNESEEVKLP